jgi:CubicO group peptidase (beta-lactamase class C family)
MKQTIFYFLNLFLIFHFNTGYPGDISSNIQGLKNIDRLIQRSINDNEIPGAVAIILKNNQILYHKSFGFSDKDSKSLMEKNSIFRIASMTKAITSVGIMMLAEDGKILLSDPVSKYISEFNNPTVIESIDISSGKILKTIPASREIQIIDLLTHTSGIGYPFIPSNLDRSYREGDIFDGLTAKPIILSELIRNLSRQPLLFEPGSSYAYGLNNDVLGYVIEIIAGMTLDSFFKKMIFEPLKMDDTYFYLPEEKESRLVTLYAGNEDKDIKKSDGTESDIYLDNPNYPISGAKTMFSGGAGLSSTAYDYSLFLSMLLNEGKYDEQRLLSQNSVKLMRTALIDTDSDGNSDFGLGFDVITHPKQSNELSSVGSYSWGGAFYTTYWIDPQNKLIGIFMSQVRPYNHLSVATEFKNLVYQSIN